MRFKMIVFILTWMVLLATVQPLPANELQRLVFNAAGNIGLTAAFVEVQGITPGNSVTLNGYINTAITMLNQLISQYNDPPFDSDQIGKIVAMLQRFPQATGRMNNRGKASYLRNCYSNLKSAMSLIFRSDFGTKYSATCDTFVTDLGYYGGQAQAGIMMNNRFIESEARSRINLALSSGTRTRDTLGCSFLSADQVLGQDVQNRRTSAEFSAMLRELENDVRLASLNLEPGFDSPATKGTLTATNRIVPPPPTDNQQTGISLVGRWQTNSLDGTTINFVQEGSKIRGYICNLHRYRVEEGYRENELVIEVTRVSDRQYTGSLLYKDTYRARTGLPITWTPVRIELADNTSGAGREAYITYTHPHLSTGTHQWHYHRVQ